MAPALPRYLVDVDQLEVGLVDQPCGVQGVIRAFLAQPGVGQSFEVLVDQRHEPVERLAIALGVGNQELGDVGLWLHDHRTARQYRQRPGSARGFA